MGGCGTVVCFVVCLLPVTECRRLNDYILDYRPLLYDKATVHKNHERVRRAADTHLHLRFNAYGRDFRLKLVPVQDVFTIDHQLFSDGQGPRPDRPSYIYQGQVLGEPESRVDLSVHGGRVEGHLRVADTTFHIEPATKYLSHPAFHTIIYPETHLNTDPYRQWRETYRGQCAVGVQHVQHFMDRASRAMHLPNANHTSQERVRSAQRTDRPYLLYTDQGTRPERASHRRKRSLGGQNACHLHMRADPLLFRYFKQTKHQHTISDVQAEEEILAFFSAHVKALNNIYSSTVFQTYDGDLQNVGINFVIHRSTIMKDCTVPDYCHNVIDVSNFLDLTSSEDHDLFCLVFTFTYRDFSGGTLGLAWVATPTGIHSGVCGRHKLFAEGKKKSLNTAIVTIRNFGKVVPSTVSHITLAHEAGHNFGAPHDLGSEECAPFGTSRSDANDGNYIMFPSATNGDRVNNLRFSACSKDNVTRIIQQMVDGQRHMCFIAGGAFCGNRITEAGEECDCGIGTCAADTCCEGRNLSVPGSGCRLATATTCSPDSGPCCSTNCTYMAADSVCVEESECSLQTKCTGNDFSCPDPQPKPDGAYCNNYSKVCKSGECIGTVCQKITDTNGTWDECFLTSEVGDDVGLCYRACKNPSNGQCVSSNDVDVLSQVENTPFKNMLTDAATRRMGKAPTSDSDLAITLPPGSACDNFRGYCDMFSKCQRIDVKGPFDQLTSMIFNRLTLSLVKDWIVTHWWAMLLMSVGLVVLVAVFIKVCGHNTPSKDPAKHGKHGTVNRRSSAAVHPYSTGVEMTFSQVPKPGMR